MNYGNDENFVVLDAVDDPIAVDEVLADFLITRVWHDAFGNASSMRVVSRILLTTARV